MLDKDNLNINSQSNTLLHNSNINKICSANVIATFEYCIERVLFLPLYTVCTQPPLFLLVLKAVIPISYSHFVSHIVKKGAPLCHH